MGHFVAVDSGALVDVALCAGVAGHREISDSSRRRGTSPATGVTLQTELSSSPELLAGTCASSPAAGRR
jgi:hypothetical protein